MRRQLLRAVAVWAACILAGSANAQVRAPIEEGISGRDVGEGGAPPKPGAAKPRRPTTLEEFVRYADRNGDGKLSVHEVPISRHDVITELDRNGDGAVDLEEARAADRARAAGAPPPGRRGRTLSRTVTLMDTNGDGRLQKKEAPLALQQRFETFDLDGDGAIDAREAAAADAAAR